MWRHNLKISLRGIINDKWYSLINITGLGIAIACSFLFIFWVKFELSYEQCYPKADRIYRLMDRETRAIGPYHSLRFQYRINGLADKFPQIEQLVGVTLYSNEYKAHEEGKESQSIELKVASTTEAFIRMFAFEYIEGSPMTIARNRGVALSREAAERLFGKQPALGQLLSDRYGQIKVVDAVINVPENSELHFELLDISRDPEWGGSLTFIMLKEGEKMTPELRDMIGNYPNTVPRDRSQTTLKADSSTLLAQPILKTHLFAPKNLAMEMNSLYTGSGDLNQLYIFSAVALLILLIAILNYVNTSIARSMSRMKEVGVRKVTGAVKGALIKRFLFESFLITLIAMLLSLVLVKMLFPLFSEVMGNKITFLFDIWSVVIAVIVCAAVSLLSGAYAAFYVSGFSPTMAFRGGSATGSKEGLRKVLLAVQFFLAITILTCTAVVYKQIDAILNSKNGMDRENILNLQMKVSESFIDIIKQENPDIIDATAAHAPPYQIARGYTGVTWTDAPDETKDIEFGQVYSDHHYGNTFGLELVQGTFLASGRGRTSQQIQDEDGFREIVINETMKKLMGLENPVGAFVKNEGGRAKIVGVVKDFNFKPLNEPIQPLMISYEPDAMFRTYIKTTGRNLDAIKEFLRNKVKEIYPSVNVTELGIITVEEDYSALHKSELRTGKIMTILSAIALFLSLLGVMSMISFILEKRTKDIAIRKINGASIGSIITLFSTNIVWIALAASVVSVPISFYAMSKWLETYYFRTELSWWIFVAVPLVVLAITLTITALQIRNVAQRNPVDALRSE